MECDPTLGMGARREAETEIDERPMSPQRRAKRERKRTCAQREREKKIEEDRSGLFLGEGLGRKWRQDRLTTSPRIPSPYISDSLFFSRWYIVLSLTCSIHTRTYTHVHTDTHIHAHRRERWELSWSGLSARRGRIRLARGPNSRITTRKKLKKCR